MTRKILYGVQGTGQGHISRARGLAEALKDFDVDVTWLFSGREKSKLFDMEPFGDFKHREGLTMVTEAGQMKYRKTALNVAPATFLRDVNRLDLDPFDLIVCDYEPVIAWAAKARRRETIGIGHQYAFGKQTPLTGDTAVSRLVMNQFAPVDIPVGLHWAAFDNNILPPILDLPDIDPETTQDHVLVYLPFEDQDATTRWLQEFTDTSFIQYSPAITHELRGNVLRQKANVGGFKRDLATARGVICNTGFELISECLQWRKPVLTRPLAKQMEQLSNAAALEQLGYATTMQALETHKARAWLDDMPPAPKVHFQNVASALATWLARGAREPVAQLSEQLWS